MTISLALTFLLSTKTTFLFGNRVSFSLAVPWACSVERKLVVLAFLVHISVSGVTVILWWSLIFIQPLARRCLLPASAFTTCDFLPAVLFQGLIIIYLAYCNSMMTGFPASSPPGLLSPQCSSKIMLSFCLKILIGFPYNTK